MTGAPAPPASRGPAGQYRSATASVGLHDLAAWCRAESPASLDADLVVPAIELAARHRVLALLYAQQESNVEGDARARLRTAAEAALQRSLQSIATMSRALDVLEAAGVEALVYKGPALSAEAYGNPALRQFDDIDLLVRESVRFDALAALESAGYGRDPALAPALQDPASRHNAETTLLAPNGGGQVDLHWRLHTGAMYVRQDIDTLISRGVSLSISGRSVRTLAAADHLVLTAIEAAKDGWTRLESICCVDRLLRRSPSVGPPALARSGDMRARRKFLVAVALAEDLLGSHPSIELTAAAAEDPKIARLAERARERLSGHPSTSGGLWRLYVESTDGWIDTLRVMTKPSAADAAALRAPAWAGFTLYPARPIRLIGRYVRQRRLGARGLGENEHNTRSHQ